MKKIFIVLTEADIYGIGGLESHFIAMVDYFRHLPQYSISVIGLKVEGYLFYNDLFKKWNIDLHNIIDSKNIRSAKKMLLRTITDNSIVFFNSPQWYPILKEVKKYKKDCRVIMRTGGNDLWLPWRVKENFIEKSTRRLSQLFSGSKHMRYRANEKATAINSYVDTLITNSKYSTEKSIELGINRNKLFPVIGGVDHKTIARKIHKDKSELVVLNVGRMEVFKGLEYSLRAFSHAQKHSSLALRMVMIGDGPEKERMINFAESLGLEGVEFLGKINYSEIFRYFEKGDIYLHMPIYQLYQSGDFSSYRTETMGRSLLEACAAGLPIVATSVGGVGEIVKDGKNGFLVAEKDYVTAGEKILLLQNTSLRNELGLFGRKLAEDDYSWETIFDKYQELFDITS